MFIFFIVLSSACRLSLNYLCSRNIDITDRGRVATRTHSFDNAMVFSNRPLHAGDVFEVRPCLPSVDCIIVL